MNSNSSDLMSYYSLAKKKKLRYKEAVGVLFLVSLTIIESILLLATPLEML